jgi:hypothetical protein
VLNHREVNFVCTPHVVISHYSQSIVFWNSYSKSLRTKNESIFCPMLRDFRKSFAFWKVSRLRPFVRRVRATCRWRWVCSFCGMIRRGENRSTRRQTYPNITLSTTNFTWTVLGSNPGLCGERPTTNRLSDGTTFRTKLNLINSFFFLRSVLST